MKKTVDRRTVQKELSEANTGMNMLFSYGVDEDKDLVAQGHAFLGAGYDRQGVEVHVFRKSKEVITKEVTV